MSLDILASRARSLGAPLNEAQLSQFARYRSELLEWNRRVNLTAITDPSEIELRHFVDALTCLQALDELLGRFPAARLIDVGAGAGFPGLPLKIARPGLKLTLLDSVGKKTRFLEHVVGCLRLEGVTVRTARAEDFARDPAERERYQVALGRALAPLPVLLELCLPFVEVGGLVVAPRRGDLAGQQAGAARAADLLGGRFREPVPVDLGVDLAGYGLVVVEKRRPTPADYPRRVGVPRQRPLR